MKSDHTHMLVSFCSWLSVRRELLLSMTVLTGIQLLVAAVGFVTRIKIANNLGRESFGDVTFGVAIGTYGMMFVHYGLEKSLVRELVQIPERFGEILLASLIVRGFLLFILGLVVLAGALIVPLNEVECGTALVAFATVIVAFQLQGVYDAWKRMRLHAVFMAIERFTYFGLIWIVVLLGFTRLSVGLVGVFMLVSVALGMVLQYVWVIRRVELKVVRGLAASGLEILTANFWIWLGVILGLSVDYLTQIVLKMHAGSLELGGYAAAWLLVQVSMLCLSQLGRIGNEATVRHTMNRISPTERGQFITKYVLVMAVVGLLLSLPGFAFPREIMNVFKSEYADAAWTLRILSVYPLVFGPFLALLQYMVASRLQVAYFVSLLGVAGVSTSLTMWLVPEMRGVGAAISVVSSIAAGVVVFGAVTALHLKRLKSLPINTV